MTKLSTIIITIIIILFQKELKAQNQYKNWGVSVDYGTIQYNGELGNQLGDFSEWQGGYGLSLNHYLSPSFNIGIRGAYYYLNVIGPDDKNYSMFGDFYPVMTSFQYKFANGYLLKENSFIQPFINAEAGLVFGQTRGRSMDNNGELYVNDLSNLSYFFSGGFKMKITPDINCFVDIGNYWTTAVAIDGAKNDPDKDRLLRLRLGLSYSFGRLKDSDKDGVPDKYDKCPGTPRNVLVDEHGCPVDSDGDGIPDYLDECPDEPGTIENHGCPEEIIEPEPIEEEATIPPGMTYDRDGDGIADHIDECPDIPGTLENRGCPPIAKVAKWRTDIKKPSVHFTSGGTFITEFSQGRLNRLIDFMNENPNLNVWMFGHTDAIGPSHVNQRISETRVSIIMNYLIDNGISPSRLHSMGFGENFPISFGRTSDDLLRNRRVDFYLFEYE